MTGQPIQTCQRCGLNVPQSTTTYSTSGDLLCRNCGDSADFQRSVARAEASKNEGIGGGMIGAVQRAQGALETARAGGMEQLQGDHSALFQAMRKAGAETFTCRCGQTLPIDQGAYSAGGRVLCAPCLAKDAAQKPSSGCIIASACVGEDAHEVAKLRKLRDDAISSDPIARDFFHVFWSRYYEWSPGVARVANADPSVAEHIRWGFLDPWLAWMEFVTQLGTKDLDAIEPAERDAILRRLSERRKIWLEQLPALFEGKRPKSDEAVYAAFERFRAGAQEVFGKKEEG